VRYTEPEGGRAVFDLDRLKAECSAAVAGRGGLQAVREVIARTKVNASRYPASLQRDTIRALEVRGRMRRREFIVGLAMLTNAHGASAQGRARRVGALVVEQNQANILETVLKQKGWLLGQNLQVEYRVTRGDTDLSRAQARELLAMQPDVLFAVANTSMAALHAEHSGIPTVFAMVSDPVGMHYVTSFSRPGGNATGFTPFEPSLGGKWVSLIKEAAPNVTNIGIVYNPEPGNNSSAFRKSIDEVARKVGIASIVTPSGDSSDIDRLIRSLKNQPKSGLIFLPDAITFARRVQITALVEQCKLPAIYPLRSFCEAGGLMSYGVNIGKVIAGAASYVDLILRGTSPAQLPVQAPTEFELVVNQKTARRLGLQLPPTLLARADEVRQ
jgi:putative ABC transport system substrate-binding protein